MFNWLKNLFKPKCCAKNYSLPAMSDLERNVYVYMRHNKPAKSCDLAKITKGHNLGSVIRQLRRKGFPIDTAKHGVHTTYTLRNRKCR